jgi:transposase
MESGIKRTQRDYTLAFKLAVVEQVEKGELTYSAGAGSLRYSREIDGSGLVAQARSPELGPMASYGRMR